MESATYSISYLLPHLSPQAQTSFQRWPEWWRACLVVNGVLKNPIIPCGVLLHTLLNI